MMAELVNETTGERVPIDLPPNFAELQAREQAKILEAAERLRRQRRRTRQETLGAQAPLEKTPGGQLAEADLSALTRFQIGRTGGPRQIDEQVELLSRKFPDTELRKIDDPTGGQTIAMRGPGREDFILLDSPDLFTLGDIQELGGDLLSGETLMTVASTIATRGGGFLKRLAGQFAGGASGRALDVAIESARGLEKDTLGDLGQDVLISGSLASIGEAASAAIARPVNILLGRGTLKLAPEELVAQETAREVAERTGRPGGLTIGQTHPLAQTAQNQAIRTSKKAQQNVTEQLKAALEDLRIARDNLGEIDVLNDDVLEQAVREVEAAYFRVLPFAAETADPARGGRALVAARNEYLNVQRGRKLETGQRSGGRIGRFYDRAIAESQGVEFDISELQTLAADLKEGIRAAAEAPEGVRVGPDLGGANKVINTILEMDPKVRPFEGATGFEQLKELRTALFDLKNANIPGQEDPGHRTAGLLYDKITEIMENPSGGSGRFVELMRRANRANFRHERVLEAGSLVQIAQAAKTRSPESLVRAIAKPGNGTQLRMMRGLFNAKDWQIFQQQFKASLLAEPETLVARLAEFRRDPRALRQLLTQDEAAALEVYGNQIARIRSGPVKKSLDRFTDRRVRMMSIMEKSDAAQLTEFMNAPAIGGKTTAEGQAARASMFALIVDNSFEIGKAGPKQLDATKAVDFITKLDESGKLAAVLLPDEVEFLRKRRDFFTLLKSVEDVGAGIQQAGIAAKQMEILSPIALATNPAKAISTATGGLSDQTRNAIVGQLLTSPSARTALVGLSQKPLDLTTLRMLSAVSFQMLADIEPATEKKFELTEVP